jgi:hypothetical protein
MNTYTGYLLRNSTTFAALSLAVRSRSSHERHRLAEYRAPATAQAIASSKCANLQHARRPLCERTHPENDEQRTHADRTIVIQQEHVSSRTYTPLRWTANEFFEEEDISRHQ